MSDRRLHSYFRGQSPGFRWSDYLRQPNLLPTVEEAIPTTPTPQVPGPFLGEYSGGNVPPPVQEEQVDEDGWEPINIKIGTVVETHRFKKFDPEYTSDFNEDLALLRSHGFVIESDKELGSGNFGVVYRGYYGHEVQDFDKVDQAQRFAVKVIEFNKVSFLQRFFRPFYRESFESEKYVMTQINHKNCVKIQYIAHLGEQKLLHFRRHPEAIYMSPDRAYLFMEYANGGTLERWLAENNDQWLPFNRIKFIRDLFSGMRYLHRQKILHGDVHVGNILLFREGVQITAKWTDFGLSRIASEEQFSIRDPEITEQYFYKNCRSELKRMIDVFRKIIENRMKSVETPHETYQLNQYQQMVYDYMSIPFSTIDELYDQFRKVLDKD